jgi:hypothetical protein
MPERRRLQLVLFTALALSGARLRAEPEPLPAPPSASAPAPKKAPHPEPRVIVNVVAVHGPHERTAVERSAREGWGRVVKCYKSFGRGLKGMIGVEFAVASQGKVIRVRRTRSSLKSGELAACLSDSLLGLTMPKAAGGSTAFGEIHVAPGDPP